MSIGLPAPPSSSLPSVRYKRQLPRFADTKKLILTGYLQLVDRGVLTLDTDMTTLFPPLKAATAKILVDVDLDSRQPHFEPNDQPVTLQMMLNQTSGFGREFGDMVPKWKQITDKGKGFVNSCKVVRDPQQLIMHCR